MSIERRSETFGRFLAAQRLEKGISLKEVSRKTRIGTDMLSLIENENHSLLPAEVFVKGFLRAYAKTIDADGEKAVGLYTESLQIFRAATASESKLIKSRERFWLRLLAILGLLVLIIGITLYATVDRNHTSPPPAPKMPDSEHPDPSKKPVNMTVGEDKGASSESVGQEAMTDAATVQNGRHQEPAETEDAEPGTQGSVPADPPPAPEPVDQTVAAEPGKYFLKVKTIEKTWLKIIVDHHDPVEYSLEPGEELAYEATHGYNLLVGNATGVILMLNDKAIPIPGKKGQVVTLQIP